MSGSASKGKEPSPGPAPTRLRQIALVTADLEATKELITHILGTEVVYEDAGVALWGLKNCLIPLGGDFIELVAPFKDGTTAGRLLEKRGEGGYMVIMQTEDAKKRRDYLQKHGLAKVIFTHDHDDVISTQYHPKGIKGGMMPELDSHAPGPNNPTPLQTRFSPWHACGPDYSEYGPGMQRSEHLTLAGAVLRLQPGDADHEGAARQWEELFGVARSRDLIAFTNARLGFVPGREGQQEGLVSITVGVDGRDRLEAMVERAQRAGVGAGRRIRMGGGVSWDLVLTGHGEDKGKL